MAGKLTERGALRLARRRYGKAAAIESFARRRGPSSPERRAAASAELEQHRAVEPRIAPLDEWPIEATIGEYRSALAEQRAQWKLWRVTRDRLLSEATYYAFRVLSLGAIFATVHGEGDSWEEALTKAGVLTAVTAEG